MLRNIRKYIAVATFALSLSYAFSASALSVKDEVLGNPEKAGGVYYAYPGPADSLAVAPDGYEPFYISHYGRHGSRYLISDEVWKEADGRGGELTPLGARQHKGIARRMLQNYPAVFRDSAEITARSTQVMRCAHSMMAFCEGLKELDPSLVIPKESSLLVDTSGCGVEFRPRPVARDI